MASIGDVVQLADGSVGVVGEVQPSPGPYRVYFDESHLDVGDDYISSTLSAPTYNVNDEVSVWPYSGTVTAIDGDEFTVSIERQSDLGFGPLTWTADYVVPRWRIIRDNDSRIERVWS